MTVAPFIRRRHATASRTRGVASLAVTLIMLALAGLVILYANRGQLFEQRVSANQSRATTAFEAAEAGVEWGLARLNDKRSMLAPSSTATCGGTGTGTAVFQTYYVSLTGDATNPTAFTVGALPNMRAGCSIDEATGLLTCNCPSSGNAISIPSPGPGTRSFEVTYSTFGAVDPGIVRITAVGCRNPTSAGSAAFCNAAGATQDAQARVSILAKFVPATGAVANAALTTGGTASVCGAYTIENQSAPAGGILVNSGANTQAGNAYISGTVAAPCSSGNSVNLITFPGTPIGAAIVPNDTVLAAAATSSDTMMKAYFGMTKEQYINDRLTAVISGGGSASARGGMVITQYNAGYRRFWVDGDILINNSAISSLTIGTTLGSATTPVMIASSGDMTINGGFVVYGILYSDTNFEYQGSGTASIYGQVVVRGDFRSTGSGNLYFRDSVLSELNKTSGEFVRVPGSWKDN